MHTIKILKEDIENTTLPIDINLSSPANCPCEISMMDLMKLCPNNYNFNDKYIIFNYNDEVSQILAKTFSS